MPKEPGLSVLAVELTDRTGAVLHRNFTTFVVEGPPPEQVSLADGRKAHLSRIDAARFASAKWSRKQWNVLDGLKVNGAGSGHFEYRLAWPQGLKLADVAAATFLFEASAKQLFGKDQENAAGMGGDYMRGKGTLDPSRNPNAYPMTDQVRFPSAVTVRVNGVVAGRRELPDDPADHRGILSWHSQRKDRSFAGSGFVRVPAGGRGAAGGAGAGRHRRGLDHPPGSGRSLAGRLGDLRRALRPLSRRPHGGLRAPTVTSRSGKTSMKAWMAYVAALGLMLAGAIRSVGAEAKRARITIDAAQVEAPIDARLYGQFLEFMYEGVKGGLSAELVRNRGFEEAANSLGLSRHWERYPDDRVDDYGLSFAWDDSVAAPVSLDAFEVKPVQHSLRVQVGGGVVERHGVYQPRIPVRAGIAYNAYLWLKTTDFQGRVVVALEEDVSGGRVLAEAEIRGLDIDTKGDWKRYSVALRPERADPHARLALLFEGQGRVWVDQVSLLPGDAVGGVRADVESLVKALRPSFLRWPGGNVAQDYHWIWGVGPRDRRPDWVNLSWKNEPEPGDIGTDEFIALCRRLGAEPSITVNVEGRGATPEEAAAWVEYCNGPATSRYGALRAANGHPAPHAVKYWEVGNEIWGDWVRGHSDAPTYARNYLNYASAMRAVDPGIELIAVGHEEMDWNRTVLRTAGGAIDYLALHHYYGSKAMAGDTNNLMARPLFYERFYGEVEKAIREEAPGRPIRLHVNEWGLDLPERLQYSIQSALYGARLMNVFERRSPLVAMSAESDLVNGWPGGLIQASRDRVFLSPLYHVNVLYNRHRGQDRLKIRTEGPTFDSSREGTGIPVLDVVASRSADGSEIYVKAVNTDLANAVTTRIDVRGVKVGPQANLHLITADRLEAHNSFATPDAIKPRQETLPAGASFEVSLPARSICVITLRTLGR